MTDQLLTQAEACRAAGIEPATLRDWVRRQLIRRYGSRRAPLYDVLELAAALEAPKPRRHRGGNRPRSSGPVRS